MPPITRRAFSGCGLAGLALPLAGCAASRDMPVFGTLFGAAQPERIAPDGAVVTPDYAKVYGRRETYGRGERERHPVPAFDYTNTDPLFLRANVPYGGAEPAGTIVVDARRHRLFLVEAGGRATRYGVGVGPDGRSFAGRSAVSARQEWPDDVAGDEPQAGQRTAGIAGARGALARWAQLGPPVAPSKAASRHPFGARGIAIGEAGQPPAYIVHGTSAPDSIGQDVTIGGIRLIDQDVIDLFDRTTIATPVVVLA